jgi:hypothetical protein
VTASTLLALAFSWHYRADFVEIWQPAINANAALEAACV